jgi:multimeric flavodoxin WrbA
MKVIAFNGSPRLKGNTFTLLDRLLKNLEKEGISTESFQLGGRKIAGCSACFQCFTNQDCQCSVEDDVINECIRKMMAADAIIIGSPTYFADVTPEVKALIDRTGMVAKANSDLFKRKLGAAVIAVRRAGAIHAFDSINHFFTISQMIVVGSSYWNLGMGLEPGDVLKDVEGLATMDNLASNMAWLLKKIHS